MVKNFFLKKLHWCFSLTKKQFIIDVFFLILLFILGIYFILNFQDVVHTIEQTYYRFQPPSSPPAHHQSRIDVIQFTSSTLSQSREAKVYVPEEYDKKSDQHFPVLYLLHGDPGNDDDWLVNAHIQHTLDDLVDKHALQPLIVVFPDGNGPQIKDGQYVDATNLTQNMATYIAQEIVDLIDQKYRTISSREGRSIGGVSSGGYGAANLL